MASFDDGVHELNSGLASRGSFARGSDGVAYDCKLVCVNPADNSDKYYVLQVRQNLYALLTPARKHKFFPHFWADPSLTLRMKSRHTMCEICCLIKLRTWCLLGD